MRTSVEWPQYALQAGKGSVAFQSSRENRCFGFLRTGASGDGGMGLFAQFDPLAVRGLVLLQSCPVIVLAARRCTKDSANDETFGAQDLDVVTTNELHCRRRGSKWTSPMLPIIILSLIFGAGFCLGYGARA